MGIYDCVTGVQLAALMPAHVAMAAQAGEYMLVRWSPDGARLLVSDALLGTVSFRNVSQLLRS